MWVRRKYDSKNNIEKCKKKKNLWEIFNILALKYISDKPMSK